MATFDLGQFFRDEGLTLKGGLGGGLYKVSTPDGREQTFDANAFLRDEGIEPASVRIEANTPSSAVPISPVSVADRALLTLGNAEGKLSYLKNKFGEVKYDPNNGITVNNKGVWQSVDPSGLGGGDAWEMTKEIAKDAVDLIDIGASAIASGVGATAGSVLGPAGSLGGAAAGGGLAETIRTSLGRLAGTYVATPEEQMKDIAIESILNLGGEGVALGAKATLGKLAKSFATLGENAAETTKDMIAATLGKTTGAGSTATRVMMDRSAEIVPEIAAAKAAGRTTDDMVKFLQQGQNETAEKFLDQAVNALPRRFMQLKGELVSQAEGKLANVNIGSKIDDMLQSMADSGLLKKAQDGTFQIIDDMTAISRRNSGLAAEILPSEVQKEIAPVIQQLNNFTQLGQFTGSKAASELMDLKKTFNTVLRNATENASREAKPVLAKIGAEARNMIGGVFHEADLTPQYMKTVNLYEDMEGAVTAAKKLYSKETGAADFVKKIVGDFNGKNSFGDISGKLVQAIGGDTPAGQQAAQKLLDGIVNKEVAKNFTSWLPSMGLASNVTVGGTAGALASGLVNPVQGAAALASTSPRLVGNLIQYSNKALDALKSLPKPQRIQLLQNPEALNTLLRTPGQAAIQQQQLEQQLVNLGTGRQNAQ